MKAFALLAVLLLALAGCSGKHKDGGPTTTTSSSSSTSAAPANGTIEVLVNRTTPNGAAPLRVNFTIDATFRQGSARAARPGGLQWSVGVLQADLPNGTHDD